MLDGVEVSNMLHETLREILKVCFIAELPNSLFVMLGMYIYEIAFSFRRVLNHVYLLVGSYMTGLVVVTKIPKIT